MLLTSYVCDRAVHCAQTFHLEIGRVPVPDGYGGHVFFTLSRAVDKFTPSKKSLHLSQIPGTSRRVHGQITKPHDSDTGYIYI